MLDSWVPSIRTGAVVSCKVTTSTASTCTSANLRGPTFATCVGCLDAHQILKAYFGSGINLELDARYP